MHGILCYCKGNQTGKGAIGLDKKKYLTVIADISNAPGASGFEDEVVNAARRHAVGLGDMTEDAMRNLYIRRAGNTGSRPVVMLDAHSDEVSFMVHSIKPNGTLRFMELGGWVPCNVPAHRVKVRNADGIYIDGVIASKPPHFMSAAEKAAPPDVSQMVIDIGATSAQDAIENFRIRIGEPIVPDVTLTYDEAHDLLIGKAFDCRMGCAAVIGTLDELQNETLAVDVVGALSTQEEVGTRGATVTAQTVAPDIAIVFEGCPADDTFGEEYAMQTRIKKGPYLRHIDARMITNPRFQRYALALGEKLGIPVQDGVRTGGSTDGAPIHLSNRYVPTIVVGIPVRYIHTHYGIATYYDFENAVKLAAEVIKTLNADVIAGF